MQERYKSEILIRERERERKRYGHNDKWLGSHAVIILYYKSMSDETLLVETLTL